MSAIDKAAQVIADSGRCEAGATCTHCRRAAHDLADAGLLVELTWESTGDNRLGQPTGRWVGPIHVSGAVTAPTPDTWVVPSGLTSPETAPPATETRREPEPAHSPTPTRDSAVEALRLARDGGER